MPVEIELVDGALIGTMVFAVAEDLVELGLFHPEEAPGGELQEIGMIHVTVEVQPEALLEDGLLVVRVARSDLRLLVLLPRTILELQVAAVIGQLQRPNAAVRRCLRLAAGCPWNCEEYREEAAPASWSAE